MRTLQFETTAWEDVERTRRNDPEAWQRFADRYRPPIVAFLLWRGFRPEDAEDLAQEVFVDLVQGGALSAAGRERGRFRTLLLAVTKKIISKERRRRAAAKRGGGTPTLPLEDVPAPQEEPQFDRLWAQHLLATALRELAAANENYSRTMAMHLEGRSQEDMARALGKRVNDVKHYLHRARSWLERTVRRQVSEYVADDFQAREELEHLSRIEGA